MDSSNRVNDLVTVASRLIALLDEENELLSGVRFDTIGALQDEKARLARAYAGLVRDVKAEPRALAGAGPALRAELDESMDRLNRTVEVNQRALRAARAANERLMKLIVDAAAAQRPSVSAYGRNGVMAGRPTKTQPLSLTFDQRL